MSESVDTAVRETNSEAAGKATILLVDDEQNILTSLRRTLRRQGYQVRVADSGAAGLAVLEQEPVDLVISDMRMPEMDGAEFLARVAERWPRVVRILLTGFSDISSTVEAINRGKIYKYLSKPWDDHDLQLTVRRALEQKHLEDERLRLTALVQKQNAELRRLNESLEQRVRERTAELEQAMGMVEKAYAALKDSYAATVRVFASVVEMREGRQGGHARRVAEWARDTAVHLGLDEDTVQQVYYAGLLHDIGKMGMSDTLLAKPVAAMSPEEQADMKRHPLLGEGILLALEPLEPAARMIRSHHERYDGRGYPDGLEGEAIPPGARILAVASDFDDLQHGLLLREALTADAARRYLHEHRGSRYDPQVVEAFLAVARDVEVEPQARECVLSARDVSAGMVLTRDLTLRGTLLLARGYRLDERVIIRLRSLERAMKEDFRIHVMVPVGEQPCTGS